MPRQGHKESLTLALLRKRGKDSPTDKLSATPRNYLLLFYRIVLERQPAILLPIRSSIFNELVRPFNWRREWRRSSFNITNTLPYANALRYSFLSKEHENTKGIVFYHFETFKNLNILFYNFKKVEYVLEILLILLIVFWQLLWVHVTILYLRNNNIRYHKINTRPWTL